MRYLVLMLMACSPSYEAICAQHEVALLGGDSTVMDCARALESLHKAKSMMTTPLRYRAGDTFGTVQVYPNAETWEREMASVKIWVADSWDLDDTPDEWILTGQYSWVNEEVKLTRTEEALLHELLHRVDANRLKVWAVDHTGWFENGYFALSRAFADYVALPR